MKTILSQGFGRGFFSLGQSSMTASDRDHYLLAINRGLNETQEIDDWISAHPDTKFRPGAGAAPGVVDSPYYTMWANYQNHRSDLKALRDRLNDTDPVNWFSLTEEEHGTFGWVAVVDRIYSAFQADPVNLTAGVWQGNTRQPDVAIQTEAAAPSSPYLGPVLLGAGALAVIGIIIWAGK